MSAVIRFLHLDEVTRRSELAILIGLGIMESFSWTLIKPMLPLFATSLGAKELLIGAIVAVPPLIQIFTRIPSGAAAMRYGKRRMIFLSFFLTAGGAALLTITRSISLIFVAQVFVALGESMFWPANWAYVTSLAPRNKQGTIVALVMGVQGIIGLLMPYIGGRIFDAFGFSVNGAIYTAAGLTGLLLATRLPRVEPVTVRPTSPAAGAPASNGNVTPTPSTPVRKTSLGGARALLARKEILIAAFSGSIIFFSWGISGAFYSIYVKEGLGFTATTVGILLTWQSAFNTIARLGFAQMAHRVRIDRVLLVTGVANALPLMLLPWIRTLPMLMAVAAVTGLASGVVPISIKTLYANATNDQERSLAMGIDGVAMNIGSLASPVLAGAAAQAVGIPTTFFVGNLLTIAALFASRRAIDRPTFVRSISGRDPEMAPAEDGFAETASS